NHLCKIKDNVTLWKTSLRKNKVEEIILARLRVGHTKITHSYLIKKEPRPSCHYCNVFLTVEHIFQCRKFRRFRNKLSLPPFREALSDNEENVSKTIKYLKMLNLFSKF
ncbi:hypothetical protein WDU94_006616, partial [Cyamophila willieti]